MLTHQNSLPTPDNDDIRRSSERASSPSPPSPSERPGDSDSAAQSLAHRGTVLRAIRRNAFIAVRILRPGFTNEDTGQTGQMRKLSKARVRMGLSTSCRIVDVICASAEPDGMTVKCHHYWWAPRTRPACSRVGESWETLIRSHNALCADPHGAAGRPEAFALLSNSRKVQWSWR